MKTTISLLRRRPDLARLWLAGAVSELGDWLSLVAVSLLAVDTGGGTGALALAGVLLAHNLPGALLAPLSGWLADRLDQRRLLMAVHLLQGAATVGMAMAAAGGSLLGVTVLLWVRTAAGGLDAPARSGLLTRSTALDERLLANALMSASWSVIFALGMGLGGLMAGLPASTVLLIDAATFGVAVMILRPLPAAPPGVPLARGSLRAAQRQIRADLLAAAERVRAQPLLMDAVTAKAPLALAGGAAWVVMNLVAVEHAFLASAGLTLGLLQVSKAVGTAIGPYQAARSVERTGAGRRAVLLGLAGMGLFVATTNPWMLLLASLAWGWGSGANWVLSTGLLQEEADQGEIGRLTALDLLLMAAAQTVGSLGAAALIEHGWAWSAAGGVAVVAGLALWGLLQLLRPAGLRGAYGAV